MVRSTCTTGLICLLLLSGCERKGYGAPPEAADPQAALYTVDVAVAPAAPGQEGRVTFTLRPASGLKWNEEYPTGFKVSTSQATIVEILSPQIRKKDPLLVETAKQAVVSVPFRAKASGSATVEVQASFSVCTETQCHILRNRGLKAEVEVP